MHWKCKQCPKIRHFPNMFWNVNGHKIAVLHNKGCVIRWDLQLAYATEHVFCIKKRMCRVNQQKHIGLRWQLSGLLTDLWPDLGYIAWNTVNWLTPIYLFRFTLSLINAFPCGCSDKGCAWIKFYRNYYREHISCGCEMFHLLFMLHSFTCGLMTFWWILFPHASLTICVVLRVGDGSFAVEHPPDLSEWENIYKTIKQIIYYTTNREAVVYQICKLLNQWALTLPLLCWLFCILRTEGENKTVLKHI